MIGRAFFALLALILLLGTEGLVHHGHEDSPTGHDRRAHIHVGVHHHPHIHPHSIEGYRDAAELHEHLPGGTTQGNNASSSADHDRDAVYLALDLFVIRNDKQVTPIVAVLPPADLATPFPGSVMRFRGAHPRGSSPFLPAGRDLYLRHRRLLV